ncbi:phosphoribosylformimino-5-aminoimidazole carboxamide ribotide isomerase [Scopulibacillus daqui]|uniref:1-(5-phosphoribosyl)-5-[(5-phosphoribosylamino)methylideneamino] imidazole-4-carboxamide isomerase n=1 Tax=Scopulibacillus daqui TaxID=1469162 RepID=A0ABS2PY74_9BACL|nr:1-(5-phosphoribosyl)-5-[(5-phosphoribosylamino)methylideneamino]imidazole-4-carboxamide isomerase [Scopulibacillus daqui]MBM7645003.1 phosphoribosylformimino-5-aminoimidazole carboxamide ribotide isomerase [Scopulibacillus daqui]
MQFTIFPAIDIRGGRCVRLYQGDFNHETVYHDSPVSVAKSFYEQGAQWLHLVDLDGAKEGKPANLETICEIASSVPIPVEAGGGIRDMKTVDTYLGAGVKRVILGSSAISEPAFVNEALREYPDHIAIGIDVRDGKVAIEGWIETSETTDIELAKRLTEAGARTFIYTDISRDGTLKGPNIEAISQLAIETGQNVIASGGVSTIEDVKKLAGKSKDGVAGAIIGKALYTRLISLREALEVVEYAD